MSRLARLQNRAFQSTVASTFRLRAEIDYPFKLTATDFSARSAALARLGDRFLRASRPGDPTVVTNGRRWRALELVDLESDPAERCNLLEDGERLPREIREWALSWADTNALTAAL
jgi:hypothetical protein